MDTANDLASKGRSLYQWAQRARQAIQVAQAAAAAIGSGAWIPFVIAGVVILIIVFIIILGGGGTGQGASLGSAQPTPGIIPPGGGGSIISCTFYRGGDTIQGVKFGNPEMAQFVESVAAKVGVPPAVIAGIMRVESGSKLALTDVSYFTADYDSTSSGVAYGLMQFVPSTFRGVFNNNSAEMNSLFGKTQVRTVIDPRTNVYPNNYLRIYSIRDSIIATAFLVKNNKRDINGDGPWDKDTISKIAATYYSGNPNGCTKYPSCTSGPYDYGEDVWRSYSECVVTPPSVNISMTCPLDPVGNSAYITCGTANHPVNLCGHGGIGYPICTHPPYAVCPYSEQLKNSFDAVTSNLGGARIPVYLPTINRTSVQWNFVNNEYLNSSWGWRHYYSTQFNGQAVRLELTHLNNSSPIPGPTSIASGTQVAITHPIAAHLHTGVTIDGRPVDPITDLFMCTGN